MQGLNVTAYEEILADQVVLATKNNESVVYPFKPTATKKRLKFVKELPRYVCERERESSVCVVSTFSFCSFAAARTLIPM